MSRAVAAVFAAVILAVTGCSAGSAPAGAPYPEAPDQPEAPQPTSAPGERQIARTASITLVVADVEQAAGTLRQVAESVGGTVTSERISLPGEGEDRSGGYSEAVVSVPAERLEESLGLIGGLGEVRQRSIESVDVTDSVLDVDARVKTMRESIARLQELMSRAGSVAEIAQVEAELSQRQADLESLLAQQKSLQNRVAMTPITVGLYPPERANEAGAMGFVGGLTAGWNSLVTAGQLALTALGVLLPWMALAAVVGVPLVWWRRRRRAAGSATVSRAPDDRVPPPAGPAA
ncbi:MAG: DUF4349 domain-containing protein [Propionibacteriaceae bacterium]|nr:DUF4349 domain-containing protein [Propionibacteriaceae bacterium]